MDKFLISLDLDGTLLTSQNSISEYTKNILKRVQERGHKLIIASGRAPRAIKRFYYELNLDTPVICYNGAMLLNNKYSEDEKNTFKFKKEKILEFCSKFGDSVVSIMCENEDTIWTNADDEFLFSFYRKDGMNVKIDEISKILDKDPITFIAKYNDTPENREKIVKIIETDTNIRVRFWDSDNYFELYYDGVSKFHSIVDVANSLGFDLEHIFAFGDADNDVEIITNCKHGIAMKNSSPALLSIAKEVTEFTNNEDGVAKYIQKYILKED